MEHYDTRMLNLRLGFFVRDNRARHCLILGSTLIRY